MNAANSVLVLALLCSFPPAALSQVAVPDPTGDTGASVAPVGASTIEELTALAGPRGDPSRLREEILARVDRRPTGEAATLWVQLLGVLSRVDPGSAPSAVRAVGLAVAGQADQGADILMAEVSSAPEADRATLLALAAHLADRVDELRGSQIRQDLLLGYPEATESAEATVLQARWLLRSEASVESGLTLLEQFIVANPEHPLAPEARRLFEEGGGRS